MTRASRRRGRFQHTAVRRQKRPSTGPLAQDSRGAAPAHRRVPTVASPRPSHLMFASLRVTRSVKRAANESFQPGPRRARRNSSALCALAARRDVPRASFQLTDLPSEIGILIADRLDTASRASMVLVNRTTASWVSKSLLARVNACQLTDDAEALRAGRQPRDGRARFVSARGGLRVHPEGGEDEVRRRYRAAAQPPRRARAHARGGGRVRGPAFGRGKVVARTPGRGARAVPRDRARDPQAHLALHEAPRRQRRAQPGHGRAYLPRAELRHGLRRRRARDAR